MKREKADEGDGAKYPLQRPLEVVGDRVLRPSASLGVK